MAEQHPITGSDSRVGGVFFVLALNSFLPKNSNTNKNQNYSWTTAAGSGDAELHESPISSALIYRSGWVVEE